MSWQLRIRIMEVGLLKPNSDYEKSFRFFSIWFDTIIDLTKLQESNEEMLKGMQEFQS